MVKKRVNSKDNTVEVRIDQESADKADKIQELDSLTFKNRKHVVELAINEFYIKYLKYWEKEGMDYSNNKKGQNQDG